MNYKKHKKNEFKNISKLAAAINDNVNKEKRENLRAACAEESVLSCIINNPDIANNIFSRISEDTFVTDLNKRIYRSIKNFSEQNKSFDVSFLSEKEFSLEEIGRITKIMCLYTPNMGTRESVNEYIDTLLEEKRKKNIKNENSESEIKKYIENLKKIKK